LEPLEENEAEPADGENSFMFGGDCHHHQVASGVTTQRIYSIIFRACRLSGNFRRTSSGICSGTLRCVVIAD
jgi:hypothetical protein